MTLSPSSSNVLQAAPHAAGTGLPLADIHLPDPVSIWPLAPGYWVILAATVALLITALSVLRHLKRRRNRNRYRAQVEQLLQDLDSDAPLASYTHEILALLKRAAKHAGASVALLSAGNSEFIGWLKSTSPASAELLTAELETLLLTGLYQPNPVGDKGQLLRFARHWVSHHHAGAAKFKEVGHA